MKGTIVFKVESIAKGFEVAKVLLSEGYEVLIKKDEFGSITINYNEIALTNEMYTLISYHEAEILYDLKLNAKCDE